MKQCGIAVFYAPLSSEAFVNLQILSDLLPFTICHEQAHEAGFASEQTANYVAFEICQNAAPEMCYSALLEVLLYGMYELHDCDSPLWNAAVAAMPSCFNPVSSDSAKSLRCSASGIWAEWHKSVQ